MIVDWNKIKNYITTTILAFLGVLSLQMSFLYTFFQDEIYSIPLMVLLMLVCSFTFCGFAVFAKHKWIAPVCVTVLFGIFLWSSFDKLVGGFGIVFNSVASVASEYFNAEVLFIDMTKTMTRYAEPAMFLYLAVAIISLIYSYTIATGKAVAVPLIINVLGVGIPVFLEAFPSFFAILFSIAYCVVLVIVSGSYMKNNTEIRFKAGITGMIVGVFLLICGGITNAVSPAEEYKQNSFFADFREEFRSRISDFPIERPDGKPAQSATSSIGGGKLGNLDRLTFSGNEVLSVTLPAIKDKVYLKGYIGKDYTTEQWLEPDSEDYKMIFNSLEEYGYAQQLMVALYLDDLGEMGLLNGFRADMKIEAQAATAGRLFSPVYTAPQIGVTCTGDGPVNDYPKGYWVEYYSVSYDCFNIEKMLKDGENRENSYEKCADIYRGYVYDNYLDVNTPMADELSRQWGSYPIDNAADRFALAKDIREYLEGNYTYNAAPGKVPGGKDFVEYCLKENKEGYCTYFATSAVMMFRSAGVPARYVEGYSFSVNGNEKITNTRPVSVNGQEAEPKNYCTVSVQDYCAHAWVEFYVDGIGWIDYEVTPGNGGSSMDITQEPSTSEEEESNTSSVEHTTPEHTSEASKPSTQTPSSQDSGIPTTEGDGESRTHNFKLSQKAERIILITFFGIIFVVVIVLLVALRHKKVEKAEETIYNNDKSHQSGASIISGYKRFEKLMKYCGYKRDGHMPYMDFAKLTEKECFAVGEGEACRLTELFEKITYSHMDISAEEIEEFREIIRSIRRRIYDNMGIFKKIIFVYILNY